MIAESAQRFEALEAQAQRLLATFTRAGYEHVAPSIIQPANMFLDVVGESLRARTYVFTDPDGEELCLRPDLTVPTCRLHLARHPRGAVPARYCYNGSAFRYQQGGDTSAHPREFRQAGIESFAAADRERADAEVVALIVEAVCDAGIGSFQLRFGDLGLFHALLGALSLPERWRRRLQHQFWRPEAFRAELNRLTSAEALRAPALKAEVINRLDPERPTAALGEVEHYLEQAGLTLLGTRTLPEITERLLAAAADAREAPLSAATANVIESYVAVKAPARAAVRELNQLLRGHRIDLSEPLRAFQRRLDDLDDAGVITDEAEFSAEFGRHLEYYTGFVFEIVVPQLGPKSPLAGGGRYDSLLAEVGAPVAVPAVGSCIHTERLLAVLQGTAA
jgi:ATP phosphoribosyltransferase regulatory subunit